MYLHLKFGSTLETTCLSKQKFLFSTKKKGAGGKEEVKNVQENAAECREHCGYNGNRGKEAGQSQNSQEALGVGWKKSVNFIL